MPHDLAEDEPLIQPHLVELLKERPRLIDKGMREKMLDNLARNMAERRTPAVVAERLSSTTVKSVADVSQPVVRDAASERIAQMNGTILENI